MLIGKCVMYVNDHFLYRRKRYTGKGRGGMIRTSNENNPIIPWCVWFAVCEDYYGQCRMPGDRFPYNMRGRLRRDCTCQASGATVRYICYD